ncbi:thiamine pyrophosphate-binding protein, partial [Noviherbaspirillum soli]|uniref:thiamine pyrophosphate-binding protein n=1 Tax=Noviherbaspirillum soli TaxID=1064518 RepID=UPI0022646AB1
MSSVLKTTETDESTLLREQNQQAGQAQGAEPAEQTDGFHVLLDALKANDVETIYGLVGIPITDLARLAQAEGFRFIGFRHEANAVNAAAIAGYLTK